MSEINTTELREEALRLLAEATHNLSDVDIVHGFTTIAAEYRKLALDIDMLEGMDA